MKRETSGRRIAGAVSGAVWLGAAAAAGGPPLWINEFHYDNAGTDTGEFVEIVAPRGFTDLAAVRLTLYNGGDGTPYGSSHALDSFTPGDEIGDLRFYSKLIGGLQNGAPDGMSLDLDGTVLQFLSYEGAFAASAGPAAGLGSTDIGVMEVETAPPGGAVGLLGAGGEYGDFAWGGLGGATPGGLNQGQSVVPEPGPLALFGAGCLVAGGLRRFRGRGGNTTVPPGPGRGVAPASRRV